MGLLSFLNKNKQDKSDDEAVAALARSKRPSHAGEGAGRRGRNAPDPLLPEKKRARRRLVGAFALALAAAIGLPMLLDSEPKQVATDIAIQIPSKDKSGPLPAPAVAQWAPEQMPAPKEVLPEPAAPVPEAKPADPPPVAPVDVSKTEAKPAAKPEVKAPEPKQEVKAPEPKPAAKPEVKAAEAAPKHETKAPEPKPAAKPADDARALAILEGKGAATADKAAPDSHRYVVQVGAYKAEKVAEIQNKLKAAGIPTYTQKVGDLTRVRVGPFQTREEADKMNAKVHSSGLGEAAVLAL